MRNIFKRPAMVVALTMALVLSMALGASAAATTKALSTNFTLVNLSTGSNSGTINYIKSSDGSAWRAPETFNLVGQGAQLIKRQYDADAGLSAGSGSVVVSTSGPMGAVVQIQARPPQVATRGAYSGSTGGAQEAFVPLVGKNGTTATGTANSQIIVQNTGSSDATVEIRLINGDGSVRHTKNVGTLGSGVSYTYDLSEEGAVPNNWFGSAVARATNSGGQVAVVSNFFTGPDGMQTFNAFTAKAQSWLVPLFTSRLANGLSTPIAVQNLSGSAIPANGIEVVCTKDPQSPDPATLTLRNNAAVGDTAAYYFNPVTDNTIPATWFGSCRVNTAGHDSVVFVQMRYTTGGNTSQAAAYEGIPATGTNTKAIIPLYMKRLQNGFATAVTIQNLSSSQAANVTLTYTKGEGQADNCSASFTASIPASGSLIQNHRLNQPGPGFVSQLGEDCFGTLVVTSNTPIDSFVQITDISGAAGDTFQAHNGFTTNQ